VRQEKDRLNHYDEANKTPTSSHEELDSPTCQLDCSYLLSRISMNPVNGAAAFWRTLVRDVKRDKLVNMEGVTRPGHYARG
jgi:hypothetical protein